MDLSLKTAKIVGTPGDTGWAQALDYTPDDKDKKETRGRLLVIATFSEPQEGINSILIGREIISLLQESYYNSSEKTAFTALQYAVGKVTEKYKENFKNIELACASFVNNVVYSVACNGSQALIYRDSALAKILVSTKGSCVSASGHPTENDLFLLASAKFFTKFSDGVIKAAMETSSATSAGEQLMPTVHASDGVSDLAAMFVSFEKETDPVQPEQDVVPPKQDEVVKPTDEKVKGLNLGVSKLRQFLPKRKLYVRKRSQNLEEVKSKKTTMSVGLILLILLMVSIFFGVRQKRATDHKSSYEDRLVQAEHAYEEAVNLASLDADRARELYVESETIVEGLENEGIEDERLSELSEKQKTQRGKILGEYKAEVKLYVDPSLYSESFNGDHISTTSDKIYVLDTGTKRVVRVETNTKNAEVVANPDNLKKPQDLASYSDRAFALEDDGIYQVSDTRKRVIEEEWSDGVFIYAYSGNFYVLDKETSIISRYPGLGEGFASGSEWFAPGIEVDLSNSASWTIDGSIWIVNNSGKVRKYTQGLPDSIGTIEYQGASLIYTNDELENIYLLDKDSGKVIIVDKDGNYKAQYVDEGLKGAKGLSVNEADKLVVVLNSEGKLYSFELVHTQ